MNQTEVRYRDEGNLKLSYVPIERMISLSYRDGKSFDGEFNQGLIHYPVRAVVDINSECNARCSYCSQTEKRGEYSLKMDEIGGIVDELESMKVFELTIRGGESTIHPEFNQIWDYATSRDYLSTNVITNGIALTEDEVAGIIDNPRTKIIVSLDGPNEINSAYRDPMQYNIVMDWLPKFLPARRDQFVILSTIYEENYSYVADFARFLADLGLKHYHATTLKRMGGSEFKKGGFVAPGDVVRLEEKLDKIAGEFPGFEPLISCRYSGKQRDMLRGVPMPLFTDFHSGTGLKLTSDGNVGISKVVFFTNFFKRTVGKKLTTSLEPIGNIRDGRTLSEIWEQGFELRLAQGSVIDRNYEYYVGWEPIESVL
jgi:MoaA/NifB/PqqE/SkfB family radical SAM enzyme